MTQGWVPRRNTALDVSNPATCHAIPRQVVAVSRRIGVAHVSWSAPWRGLSRYRQIAPCGVPADSPVVRHPNGGGPIRTQRAVGLQVWPRMQQCELVHTPARGLGGDCRYSSCLGVWP